MDPWGVEAFRLPLLLMAEQLLGQQQGLLVVGRVRQLEEEGGRRSLGSGSGKFHGDLAKIVSKCSSSSSKEVPYL